MTQLMDEWLTVEDLAGWLKVSKEWIYDRVAQGGIPYHRLGRQIRFRQAELEVWLKTTSMLNEQPA